MVIYHSQSSVIHSVPLCLILPKKEKHFLLDLSGKHSNMPILQSNKNAIWSQQTPLSEISENFEGKREQKEINILVKQYVFGFLWLFQFC